MKLNGLNSENEIGVEIIGFNILAYMIAERILPGVLALPVNCYIWQTIAIE